MRFGSDKPDLRFGLGIHDLTWAETRESEFKGVRAVRRDVQYLVVPPASSRARELADLEEQAKEWGGEGPGVLVYDRRTSRSPIAKFLSRPSSRHAAAAPGRDRPVCRRRPRE